MLHSYFFTGDNFDLLKRIQFHLYPELSFFIFRKAIDKYKNAVKITKIETELYKEIRNTKKFYSPDIERVYNKIAAYFRYKYPLESQLSFKVLEGQSYENQLEVSWRNFYYDESRKLVEDNDILNALLIALFNKNTEKGEKAINDISTFLDYKYPKEFIDDYYERQNRPTYENKSEYIIKKHSNKMNNLKIKLSKAESDEKLKKLRNFFELHSYPSALYILADNKKGIEIFIQEEFDSYFISPGFEVKLKLKGKVLKEGFIKVSAQNFIDLLLQQENSKYISLTNEDDKLIIENNTSSYEIQVESKELESELNNQPDIHEMMEIEQEKLKNMLRHVRIASDKDNIKLQGLKFELLDNKLTINATDKYRLATYSQKTSRGNFLQHAFISAKMVDLLLFLLNDTGKVYIRKVNDILIFKSDDFLFAAQQSFDEFPYYKNIVNDIDYRCEISLRTNEIKNILKSLRPLDDQNFVKVIQLKVEKDYLYITRKTIENQNAFYKIEIDSDCYQAEVSINLDYLLEFLEIIEVDQFKIKIAGPENPIVCELNCIGDYKYYIMPVIN